MAISLGTAVLSLHHFFFELADPAFVENRRFAFVELSPGDNITRALDRFYEETINRPGDRLDVTIILRPPVKFPLMRKVVEELIGGRSKDQFTRQQKLHLTFLLDALKDPKRTFERFETHPIHVLGSDAHAIFLSSNINPTAEGNTRLSKKLEESLLAKLRDTEMDLFVEKGRCKLPAMDGTYYRVPSGRYVKTFLRVGNLQQSRAALDGIFFWLVPFLKDCVGILTDTWSISSISQNISRRLTDYADAKAPCPIEMIGDYDDAIREAGQLRASDIISRFVERVAKQNPSGKVLVLISATHTGSLEKNLSEYLSDLGLLQRVQFVSLFKLSSETTVKHLRDLSGETDFGARDNLSPVEKDTAIEIDGSIYFPIREADRQQEMHVPTIRKLRKSFIDRYCDAPVVRVHHNDEMSFPDPRHHAVWLDTSELIRHPTFIDEFRTYAASLNPQPAVVISPDHAASKDLQDLARKCFPEGTQYFLHPSMKLNETNEGDAEIISAIAGLGKADAILLMDDAFVTGTRVRVYQANLRDRKFQGVFHYLTAVARPDDATLWDRQAKIFKRARAGRDFAKSDDVLLNTFHAIETIVLPNWSSDKCPWCIEAAAQLSLSAKIRRPARLSEAEGLDSNLFAVPLDIQQPSLLAGSLFAHENCLHANLFAVVASVLQQMRTDPAICLPLLGSRSFLVSTVLHYEEYTNKFTDNVLTAAVMRAALPHELVHRGPGAERKRTDTLLTFCRSKDPNLLAEVAVAAKSRKLPQLAKDEPGISEFFDG